jgi:hypothetical protein
VVEVEWVVVKYRLVEVAVIGIVIVVVLTVVVVALTRAVEVDGATVMVSVQVAGTVVDLVDAEISVTVT